jgi:hypothetical protein
MGNNTVKKFMLKKIIHTLKSNLINYKKLDFISNQLWNEYKSPKVIAGKTLANINNSKADIKSLGEVEFQVFSQFGDDGIIQWLVNKLPLPFKTFVEFGVENYRESNTRFLLVNNYWSGLVIDGDEKNVSSIKNEQIYTFFDLQAECSFITTDNINTLIQSANFNKDVGILSIDIDGNDYWVWHTIDRIEPIIIICEYNSLFGFEDPLTIAYRHDFVRGEKTPFNFYGTSLLSASELAAAKGYSFIGCNSAGNNAYFIRNDFMQYLPIPALIPEQGYVFASFTEAWDAQGNPLRGLSKLHSIDNQLVINTRTMSEERLDSKKIAASLIKAGKLNRF